MNGTCSALPGSGFKKEENERESEESGVNAVGFLFNPSILVGKTSISCLAYVKL